MRPGPPWFDCLGASQHPRRPRLSLANGLFMGRILDPFFPERLDLPHIYAMAPVRPSTTRALLSRQQLFDASRLKNSRKYGLQSAKRGNTTFFRNKMSKGVRGFACHARVRNVLRVGVASLVSLRCSERREVLRSPPVSLDSQFGRISPYNHTVASN